MIANLLRSAGIRTAYQTDLGDSDGIVQQTSEQPLPSGTPLIEWLSEASDAKCSAAVVELGSDDVRFGKYDAIQFDMLVLTGSEPSADEDYGPSSLHCALERLAPKGVVVAPADDPRTMRVVRDSGAAMFSYGVRNSADVSAKLIEQAGGISTLMITHQDTSAMMETPLCGAAMAANHAAAVTAGLLVEMKLPQIVELLSQLRTIPGRGQLLSSLEAADVIIDVAGTAERSAATLRMARSMKRGKLWCVLAVDESDGEAELARYGGLIERFSNEAVICASAPGQSSFLKASHAVLDGVEKCAAVRLVVSQKRAIEWAIGEARPTDTVLILGGMQGTTAQQQRSKLQTINRWIEKARGAHQAEPPQLKIYQG